MVTGTSMFSISNLYQKNSIIVSCVFIYKWGWSRQFLAAEICSRVLFTEQSTALWGGLSESCLRKGFLRYSVGGGVLQFLGFQGAVLHAGCGSQSPHVLRFCLLGRMGMIWYILEHFRPSLFHLSAIHSKLSEQSLSVIQELRGTSCRMIALQMSFFWAGRISL